MIPAAGPQAAEAEAAVLGALLLRPAALAEAQEHGLGPEDFLRPQHGRLYAAICRLDETRRPVDPVAIVDELRRAGAPDADGGLAALAEIQARCPSAENLGYWARLVRGAADLRALQQEAARIAQQAAAPGTDPEGFLAEAEERLFRLVQRRPAAGARGARAILGGVMEGLTRRAERRQSITGLPTPFPALDAILCGLQPGELLVLAARPSLGKSAWAVNVAVHAALRLRAPALVFSLEMSAESLMERAICGEARVDSQRLRSGLLDAADWTRLYDAASRLAASPLWIDDDATPTPVQIRARARRWRADRRVFPPGAPIQGLVAIDYAQLVRPAGRAENREQEVAATSRMAKALAKEIGLPVLLLAQLNREATKRDGPPRLSDLRESGSLEQDADVVAFLHRAADADEATVDLIVAKQRNGPVGKVPLAWLRAHTRFDPVDAGEGARKPYEEG